METFEASEMDVEAAPVSVAITEVTDSAASGTVTLRIADLGVTTYPVTVAVSDFFTVKIIQNAMLQEVQKDLETRSKHIGEELTRRAGLQ